MSEHEELVEEIAQDILEYYRPDGFVEVMKWDREFAESLIIRILSAGESVGGKEGTE